MVLPAADWPADTGAERTTLLLLTPTLRRPAPSKLRAPAAIAPELTEDVVLPTAKILRPAAVCAAEDAETIKTPELAAVAKPTETMPAPDTERLPRVATAELEADVVLPRANILSAVPLATVVAPEMMTTPEFAAVE